MCLEKVTKKFLHRDNIKGIGYKVFRLYDYTIIPSYEEDILLLGEIRNIKARRPVRKWLHERDFRERDIYGHYKRWLGRYPIGWHIFTTKSSAGASRALSATGAVVRKVRYRHARAKGVQSGHVVIVAKEIFILPDKIGKTWKEILS